jgi:hypothetical protein
MTPEHRAKIAQAVKRPIKSRFYKLVVLGQKGECPLLWNGTISSFGYGRFKVDGSKSSTRKVHAHRVAYQLLVGPIPEGHEIHHHCGNRLCVSPDHLVALTAEEHHRPHAIAQNQSRCPDSGQFVNSR